MSKKKESELYKNNFLADKSSCRSHNSCYEIDGDGDPWLKYECSECKFCETDDSFVFVDAICTAEGLCVHGKY